MSAEENTQRLRELFAHQASRFNLRGILGVTDYKAVYESLMPVQKERLTEIVGEQHGDLLDHGFFVSIAFVYPDGIIDNIGVTKEGVFDKESWNVYAKWYEVLNNSLNQASGTLADAFDGIPLPATTTGLASKVKSVKEYFPTVVSHVVHAEHSGIGWRGRNCLIVNPVYSCMIRLAGMISTQPLVPTAKTSLDCGECTSCLEVCKFLEHKDRLDDYRDQCLNYMNWLELDDEVCGKCIKACVHSLKFSDEKAAPISSNLDEVYYTSPTSAG